MKLTFVIVAGLLLGVCAEGGARSTKKEKFRKLMDCYFALAGRDPSGLVFKDGTAIYLTEDDIAVKGKSSAERGLYFVKANGCYSYPIVADQKAEYVFGEGHRFWYQPNNDPSLIGRFGMVDSRPYADSDIWVEQGDLCRSGQGEKFLSEHCVISIASMTEAYFENNVFAGGFVSLNGAISALKTCEKSEHPVVVRTAKAMLKRLEPKVKVSSKHNLKPAQDPGAAFGRNVQ